MLVISVSLRESTLLMLDTDTVASLLLLQSTFIINYASWKTRETLPEELDKSLAWLHLVYPITCTLIFLLCCDGLDQLCWMDGVHENSHTQSSQTHDLVQDLFSWGWWLPWNEYEDGCKDHDEVLGRICEMVLHHPIWVCQAITSCTNCIVDETKSNIDGDWENYGTPLDPVLKWN